MTTSCEGGNAQQVFGSWDTRRDIFRFFNTPVCNQRLITSESLALLMDSLVVTLFCFAVDSKTNDMQRRRRSNPAKRLNFRHNLEFFFAVIFKISRMV